MQFWVLRCFYCKLLKSNIKVIKRVHTFTYDVSLGSAEYNLPFLVILFFLSTVGPLPLSDFSTSRYNLRICFIDRDIRNNKSTLCSELKFYGGGAYTKYWVHKERSFNRQIAEWTEIGHNCRTPIKFKTSSYQTISWMKLALLFLNTY